MISSGNRILLPRLLTVKQLVATTRRSQATVAAARREDNTHHDALFSQIPPYSPCEFSLWSMPLPPQDNSSTAASVTAAATTALPLTSELPPYSPGEFSLWSLPVLPQDSTVASVTAANALPRTLAQALACEDVPLVVTTATAPHRIVHVNRAWGELCGYTDQQRQHDVLHKTLEIIQGPKTDKNLAQQLVERLVATRQPQEGYLVNYKQNGQPFANHVTMGWMATDQDMQAELLVGILQPAH